MHPTVLITGASGFLGENIAWGLVDTCALVLAYGSRPPRARAHTVFPVRLASRGDFTRRVAGIEADVVVHTAGLTKPDLCERDPALAHAVNVEGAREVARWAADRGARMIYFSTDLVFDGKKQRPYGEGDAPAPLNVYGRTKLAGEEVVRGACRDAVILRLALTYGPTRGAAGDWTHEMRAALARGKNLNLYTDQFRTPVYAGDVAEVVRILTGGRGSGTYHLGGAERLSRHAFGVQFAHTFGLPADRIVPVRMADVDLGAPRAADCSLDTTKVRGDLGLHPLTVAEGLRRQRQEEEALAG